jgi:hypothetical protein
MKMEALCHIFPYTIRCRGLSACLGKTKHNNFKKLKSLHNMESLQKWLGTTYRYTPIGVMLCYSFIYRNIIV